MSWCFPNVCAPSSSCAPLYQPLPISTGNVGLDRCGNIEVYAAPATVHRQVCWPACSWPIPNQQPGWPWSAWGGGGGFGGLATLLTGGAAMAAWMVQARRQGGLP